MHATRHSTHDWPTDRSTSSDTSHQPVSRPPPGRRPSSLKPKHFTVAASCDKPCFPYSLFLQADRLQCECDFCPSPRVQEGPTVLADPFLLSPLGARIPHYLSCPATRVAPARPVHATNHKQLVKLNDTALHGHLHLRAIRTVTCRMASHSVTCHLTQVNTARRNPARQAGTRFTYPGKMEG